MQYLHHVTPFLRAERWRYVESQGADGVNATLMTSVAEWIRDERARAHTLASKADFKRVGIFQVFLYYSTR